MREGGGVRVERGEEGEEGGGMEGKGEKGRKGRCLEGRERELGQKVKETPVGNNDPLLSAVCDGKGR